VKIPGSKSIVQRLMLIMAYSRAEMNFRNYNPCSDVLELEDALKTFGYRISGNEEERNFEFSLEQFEASEHSYAFMYNATGFRLWISFLASQPGIRSRIWVSDILLQRGYAPLTQALEAMGAEISLDGNLLEIDGTKLSGGRHHLAGDISSQYASSLILAAHRMKEDLALELSPFQVSQSYITLSLQLFQLFGGAYEKHGNELVISAHELSLPKTYTVDSDISTVAYYAVLAAMGVEVVHFSIQRNLNVDQPDIRIYDFLRQLGVGIRRGRNYVKILPAKLQGSVLDLSDCPDLMPILSILALFCQSPVTLKNIGRLRFKESDRIQGICNALDKIGADYHFDGDKLEIQPLRHSPGELELDSQNDHRLVMAFTLLKSRFPAITINDVSPLKKSFPYPYSELLDFKFVKN